MKQKLRWPPTNRQLVLAMIPKDASKFTVAAIQAKTGLTPTRTSGVLNILVAGKVLERADEDGKGMYRRKQREEAL